MSEAVETWRPVVGCEGVYEVSDLGKVRSLPRIGRGRWGQRHYPGQMMSITVGDDGYPRVNLVRDGTKVHVLVHRLVMEAFAGPCPPGEETRHQDGNHGHIARTNLEYGTQSENNYDRVRHGTHHNAIKTKCRPGGHDLFPPNLLPSKDGGRRCRTCDLARGRARWRGIRKDTPEWDALLAECYREVMGNNPQDPLR